MGDLMRGKRGLVMGVANNHSIAWGIASRLAEEGAEIAFTYQGEAFGKRVKPLADSVGSSILLDCDVADVASIDSVFEALKKEWGSIDFLVHAIAFSDKDELKGRYADTTRENFLRTMMISCFSFTEVTKRAAAMMADGGSILTLTYGGSTRVMPNYNVMGVAKAALEASVRYLANDYGAENIRVNALCPGPLKTELLMKFLDTEAKRQRRLVHIPMGRFGEAAEMANAALFLASDESSYMTGAEMLVDGGITAAYVTPE